MSKPSQPSGPVTKSPLDKREYRGLTLANEMKVLLISDPLTDKAAASLSVAAGKTLLIWHFYYYLLNQNWLKSFLCIF